MDRRIVIKEDQNPEKNFFVIRQDVLRIASDRGIPVTEVIDELMKDLQNFRNSDYEKKLDEISIIGDISDNLLKNLKLYVTKMRKTFKEKEDKEKKESKIDKMETEWIQIERVIDEAVLAGKHGTKKEIIQGLIIDINQGTLEYEFKSKDKKFILKKLNGALDEIEKQEETQKSNAQRAMMQIQKIVDREYEAGNIKNKANYLSSIKDAITGADKSIDLGMKMEEGTQEHLLRIIEERIETEKEELYFEQVRNFTKGFKFLREYPEMIGATSKIDKFTDSGSYNRFYALRELLQKEYNEQLGIELLLENGEIDDTDVRILLARKEVIDKQIKEKRKTVEIR